MIFYYSSTGNSLYVAKQLDTKLVSIPQALKENQLEYEDDVIGIVCPDYSAELPRSVKQFIEKATLKANYLYAIITYGKLDSVVGEWTYIYCKEHGILLNYVNTVNMVDNWLPGFDMLEEMAIDKKIPEQLDTIKKDLKERKELIKGSDETGRSAYQRVSRRNIETPEWSNGTALHCDTSKCIGCGICTKVCPVGRNSLKDHKRISTKDTCDFCLGCIHACPQNAFYLSIPDKNKEARYRNTNINLKEIMDANHQY